MGLLITRPEHDPGTRYLSRWSEKIIDEAVKKRVGVVDLNKTKAEQREFEGRVQKVNPKLVVLNGHGTDDMVMGHDNHPVVLDQNHALLKRRITYAVSCCSARVLGRKVADEESTYIGYVEDFVFMYDPKCVGKPFKDTRAARYLEPSNHIPIAILKGHTAKEASEGAKAMLKKHIIELLAKPSDPDTIQDIKTLWWNFSHQVCLGKEDHRL